MNRLDYLFVTDGSSDKAMTHIINWLIRDIDSTIAPNSYLVEERHRIREKPGKKSALAWRIEESLRLFPDVHCIFVHRDAEKEVLANRQDEITSAIDELSGIPPHICVIPVRMMEAWLLFDEEAIRYAASNPNGRVPLNLPGIKKIESIPDPKHMLHELLVRASELQGRRRKKFNAHKAIHRLAELIDDYSLLRNLTAFQTLENDIRDTLNS